MKWVYEYGPNAWRAITPLGTYLCRSNFTWEAYFFPAPDGPMQCLGYGDTSDIVKGLAETHYAWIGGGL